MITLTPFQAREEIKKYYMSLSPSDIKFTPKFQQRHYRFNILPNHWYKVKKRITNKKSLLDLLCFYYPINVYSTVSTWLNPHMLGKRDENRDVMLGSDFLVDIDIPFMEGGREETIKVVEFLESLGYSTDVFFTGKGSQIHIYDFFTANEEENHKLREKKCIEKMKKLTDMLLEKKFKIDAPISVDCRRICKNIEGTITKYGTVVQRIRDIDTFKPRQVFNFQIVENKQNLGKLLKVLAR